MMLNDLSRITGSLELRPVPVIPVWDMISLELVL